MWYNFIKMRRRKPAPGGFKPVEPDFFDRELLGDPKYRLWRFDNLHNRFYFEFPKNMNKSISYISVTSLSDLVLAKSPFYNRWLSQTPDAKSDMLKKAVYGTAFHVQAIAPIIGTDPIHGQGYDFDWLSETDEYGQTNFSKLFPPEYRFECHKWQRSFMKGLLAWFVFVQERIERVVAIELPLRTQKGVAATIDVVAVVKFGSKSVNAIIDIKSLLTNMGDEESDEKDAKSFYDSHEFQLETQKMIWNENYGNVFPVTHVFNWTPKNWKSEPTYTWKNHTDNQFSAQSSFLGRKMSVLDFYFNIAKVRKLYSPPSKVATLVGKIQNIQSFDWTQHVFEFDVREPGRKPKKNGDSIRKR